jgi:vitamin B12 transporter
VRTIDARFHYPTDGAGQVVDSNAVRDETRTILGATLEHRFATRAAARLELTSSDVSARSTDDPDSPADTTGFSRDRSHIARRGADARLSLDVARDARLTVGAAVEGQRVADRGESQYMRFEPSSSSFRERRTTRAAYAELLGSGERRFTYALGARLDENSTYGSFGTGRLAAGVRLRPTTRLRVAFGTAFREPAFDEAFSTAYTIGNRSLVPERTRSWEAGIDQSAFDDRLQLGARWFDQRFRDLIQYVSGTAETEFLGTYGNLAAANASGLELEAHAPRLGRFDGAASVTLLRTRVVDAGNGAFGVFEGGERLLRRPSRQASLELGARATRDLAVRGTLQLVGARDDYDFALGRRVELPAYARLDLAGEYRVAGSDVAVTARVENALDARYEPVLHFRAPGRALLLGLRVGR